MSFNPSDPENFVRPIVEGLEKRFGNQPQIIKEITNMLGIKDVKIEDLKELKTEDSIKVIKELCKKIEKGEIPELKHLRLSATQIRLLEEYTKKEASLLSKIFIKASIGTGQMFNNNIGAMIGLGVLGGLSSFKRAMDAPKGKRFSTFMDDITWVPSFIFIMPVIGRCIKGIAELKYIGTGAPKSGTTKTIKEALQKAKEELFNAKGSTAKKAAKQTIKALKKEANKGLKFWQRGLKFIGGLIGGDFDPPKPFLKAWSEFNISKGIIPKFSKEGFLPFMKTIGAWLKTSPSMILRSVLVLLILTPFCEKPLKGAIHKIFGKPYEPEEKKKELEKQSGKADKKDPIESSAMEKFLNATKNSTISPEKPAKAPAANDISNKQQNQNGYLPSAYPGPNTNQNNNNNYNIALNQLDKTEKLAQQTLQQIN